MIAQTELTFFLAKNIYIMIKNGAVIIFIKLPLHLYLLKTISLILNVNLLMKLSTKTLFSQSIVFKCNDTVCQ